MKKYGNDTMKEISTVLNYKEKQIAFGQFITLMRQKHCFVFIFLRNIPTIKFESQGRNHIIYQQTFLFKKLP